MKHLPHFLLATVTVLSLASCAAPGGGGGATAETQLGPHSAQKFEMVHRLGARTLDPNTVTSMALVLTVEQKMNGKAQEITAKAGAHKDGPHGSIQSADGVQVRILSPGKPVASTPRTTAGAGEVNVSKTIPAPNGKFQTVTAEATIQNPEFSNAHVMLTIPGDQ
ncbi:MAG TPA: hypothetical protein VGF73_03500 [Chthoniobacterales bacterium]